MKLMHWNCQGLRNPLTIRHLQELCRMVSPDVIFLTETKNSATYVQSIGESLGYYNHCCLSSQGTSGGLAIFWANNVHLDHSRPSVNYTDVYITEGNIRFCVSYIYGYPTRVHRNYMWSSMRRRAEAGLYHQYPRLVLGDFNDFRNNEEKEGGPPRSEASFELFRAMINANGLHDVCTIDGPFTWVGVRHSHTVRSKIDRAMANSEWLDAFPRAFGKLFNWMGSDHRPLVVYTKGIEWKGKRLFKYENRWRWNSEVQDIVAATWQSQCKNLPPQLFSRALVYCRNALARWKRQENRNSQREIQLLEDQLHAAYRSVSLDFVAIANLKEKLLRAYRMEEEFWKVKSGINWLQSGDRNTRFFQAKVKERRCINRISALENDYGQVVTEQEEIQQVAQDYFSRLFSSDQPFIEAELLQGQEMIHSMITKQLKQDYLALKLDITKAFDKVEWSFINVVMEKMGFHPKWRAWIMNCITSVTYSVLLNGTPTAPIHPSRGIRQVEDVQAVQQVLQIYEKASGQQVNYTKSSVMFSKGSRIWNRAKLQQIFSPSDVEEILKIRPSSTGVSDCVSWLHSKTGIYTVKTGYHIHRSGPFRNASQSLPQNHEEPENLFKAVWRMQAPPKIRMFWWRTLHNSLPVADQIRRRGILLDTQCYLCGEAEETLNHLLFQCRVTREVWSLASPHVCSGDSFNGSLMQNIKRLFQHMNIHQKHFTILPFVGWRLWKARNALHFQNKRESIVQIVARAQTDLSLWRTAITEEQSVNHRTNGPTRTPRNVSPYQAIQQADQFACLVDASWTSSETNAGIAWTLYHQDGTKILQGSASIKPVQSPQVAETMALKMAVQEVTKLQFSNVLFMGDSKLVYDAAKKTVDCPNIVVSVKNIIIDLQDITRMALSSHHRFLHVPREAVLLEDHRAKHARMYNEPYVIKWSTPYTV